MDSITNGKTKGIIWAAGIDKSCVGYDCKILDKGLMQYQIEQLIQGGINDIAVVHNGRNIPNLAWLEKTTNLICFSSDNINQIKQFVEDCDNIVFIYGACYFNVDLVRLLKFHKLNNSVATIAASHSTNIKNENLLITDGGNIVIGCEPAKAKKEYYSNLIPTALFVFSSLSFAKLDFESLDSLINSILKGGEKFIAYKTPEVIFSNITIRDLSVLEYLISSNIAESRNLKNKQKCVFLDRDGTLNKFNDFVVKPEQLIILDGVAATLVELRNRGYLLVVITNQPGIARGICSFRDIYEINNKLETVIAESGAYLDAIKFCPHHPKSGFEGEVKELKIVCNCRKPNTGLVDEAVDEFNIDISKSYFVGDTSNDTKCGKNCGCKTIEVAGGDSLHSDPSVEPNYKVSNFKDILNIIK